MVRAVTKYPANFCSQQIMKAGPDYGKANNKSVYLFSIDRNAGKVAHVNFVPQELVKSKKLDAKIWLEEANKVLGGKVSSRGATTHLEHRS
jgi:hypothetical protein